MTSAMSHPHSCYSSRCRRRCSNVVSTFCFAFRGSFVLLSSFLVMTWKRMLAMPTRMAIACWMMRLMMVAELEFLYSEAPMSRTLSSIPRLPGLSAEDRLVSSCQIDWDASVRTAAVCIIVRVSAPAPAPASCLLVSNVAVLGIVS